MDRQSKHSQSAMRIAAFIMFSISLARIPQGNRVSALSNGGEPQRLPFPQLVAFLDEDGRQFCGGSILNERYVLTAAHCTGERMKSGLVYAGLSWLGDTTIAPPVVQKSELENITVHPGYKSSERNPRLNDIAIVELTTEFSYFTDDEEKIQPVQLYRDDFFTYDDSHLAVELYGFGRTAVNQPANTNKNLYRVDTVVVPRHKCLSPRTQICTDARGRSVLDGDSGGPVIIYRRNPSTRNVDTMQLGIIIAAHDRNQNVPNIHTRASSFCSWIEANTPRKPFSCS